VRVCRGTPRVEPSDRPWLIPMSLARQGALRGSRCAIENTVLLEGARVEHDKIWFSKITVDTIEDAENIFAI
jgi:hypothetical protein